MSVQQANTPTSADACMSIVHSLMCHRQGGESEQFSKRAIESLVKKLKEKRDELDSLITAITTNGAHNTRCVTIPRTLDGRLQVAGRKCFPHVIYAKIWRWPDLHKSELRRAPDCRYSFDLKVDSVCVNPYHYIRDVSLGVDLAALTLHHHAAAHQQQQQGLYPEEPVDNWQVPDNSQPPWTNSTTTPYNYNSYNVELKQEQQDNLNNLQQQPMQYAEQHGWQMRRSTLDYTTKQEPHQDIHAWNYNRTDNNGVGQHGSTSIITAGPSTNCPPPIVAETQLNQTPPAKLSTSPTSVVTNGTNEAKGSEPVSTAGMPEHWCSITYFELDVPVGEPFKVKSSSSHVIVDGYVEQNDKNRFCLGALSNVARKEVSETTRLHIGKGIRLELEGEGDVWLHCLYGHAVFVQSHYLDWKAHRNPGEVVHKIGQDVRLKVFDLKQCYRQMKDTVNSSTNGGDTVEASHVPNGGHLAPAISHAAAAAGIGIDDLRRLCILRLAFVKGWGPDYKRKTIKETPCWIEVHLHRALQVLDEVLLLAVPQDKKRPLQ